MVCMGLGSILVYGIARIILDRRVALITAGLWITYPANLWLTRQPNSKVPFLPLFYLAVGSQANVGGAASAPVVASAFHPTLAPVGVLLAVLGYSIGTYAAWICGLMMQAIAP